MDVPQVIAGRFRIEREIGTGGMGTVYRATHLGLERPVAIKIIKQEFAGDRDVPPSLPPGGAYHGALASSSRGNDLRRRQSPDGRHFIIMEFVEGTTLSEPWFVRLVFRGQAVRLRFDLRSVGRSTPAWHHSPRPETVKHYA